MTASPVAETPEAEQFLPLIVDGYLTAAREVRAGRVDDPTRPTLRLVTRLVEKATPDADISFETPDDEDTFEGAPEALELAELPTEAPSTVGTLYTGFDVLPQAAGFERPLCGRGPGLRRD